MPLYLIIILALIGAIIIFGIAPVLVMSYFLYRALLVRTDAKEWSRECPYPDDADYVKMYNQSLAWGDKYRDCSSEVEITSDGYHLVGEYFDFGADKAAIIIAGRSESLRYSYYFSEPYRVAGYNILVIDNRSHGLSDGKYNALGTKEYRDILGWAKLLHDKFDNKKVYLHGICIGSATALWALTAEECPDYIVGMTGEGMYFSFGESFKANMAMRNKKWFPVGYFAMMHEKWWTGADVLHDGPYYRMPELKKPILFLHSKEDKASLPELSKKVFERCSAQHKIVWFDHGMHSRIRPVDTEKYDRSIIEFLEEYIG